MKVYGMNRKVNYATRNFYGFRKLKTLKIALFIRWGSFLSQIQPTVFYVEP